MNYSEHQILEKAKKILKDLNGQFYKEENIENAWYNDKKELARPDGKIISAWTISINEPVFDSSEFLVISDKTGEPLYIQGKHSIYEIKKNEEGNYY